MEKTAEQLRREHIALEGDTHGKNKWAILFTVLVMTFMACLDASIVTVALPVMQKELGVGLDRIQLVSSAYLLATCVAMLPFGRLGDVRGKVNVFQLGVIVFTGGSLLCGLSASLEVLILARIVQGIGCAAAMANNMGIITESFPAYSWQVFPGRASSSSTFPLASSRLSWDSTRCRMSSRRLANALCR